MQELTPHASLSLHPHELLPDGEDVIAKRLDLASYISLSPDAARILACLHECGRLDLTLARFESEGLAFEDLRDFVLMLAESQFIHRVNGHVISAQASVPAQTVARSTLAGMLFGSAAWIVYGAIAIASLLLFVFAEQTRPAGDDFYFSGSGLVSLIVNLLGMWAVVFIHEFGHVYAARREGIAGRISWGYRFIFLVIETDVSDIWSIPRNRRYSIYMGGLAWTFAIILVLQLLLFAPLPDTLMKLDRLFILLLLQTIVFQFVIILRTDLYYVLTNYFRIDDLYERTLRLLGRLVRLQAYAIRQDWASLAKRDRLIEASFLAYSIVGIGITGFLFIQVDLPFFDATAQVIAGKLLDEPLFSAAYWDGIFFATLLLNPIVIVMAYWGIDWHRARTARRQQLWTRQ
jgi:putative peptide zinc metalloprotease protein